MSEKTTIEKLNDLVSNGVQTYHRTEIAVSSDGISNINYTLGTNGFNYLPDDFNWQFVNRHGKITKRIAKLYKLRGYSLNAQLLSIIGQIARDYSAKESDITYDLTQEFNWNSGDFGDSGSCFFGGRGQARSMMSDVNSYAFRYYAPGTLNGIGRFWIIPLTDETVSIINIYGKWNLIKGARILAELLETDYKKLDSLECGGSDSGMLWINNSGASYIVGDVSEIRGSIELEDYHGIMDDSRYSCESCGDSTHEDNMCRVGEDYLCEDCYNNSAFSCERCAENHYSDDGRVVNVRWMNQDTTELWCESCADYAAFYCEDCCESHSSNDGHYVDSSSEHVCNDCFEGNYTYCEDCGENYHNDDITENLCESCHDGKYTFCDDCGVSIDRGDEIVIEGQELCPQCIPADYVLFQGEYVKQYNEIKLKAGK